jgi:hypothetical protein
LRLYSLIVTLYHFKPAIIGHPLILSDCEFSFHYTFHTIPCLGFTARIDNKSLYFSGDTFYDPDVIQEYVREGKLSKRRGQ